jgi:hypothetical protein
MDLSERIELRAELEAQRIKRVGVERAALMPPPSTRRGDVDRVRDIRITHRIVEGQDDREAFFRFTRATQDQQNE